MLGFLGCLFGNTCKLLVHFHSRACHWLYFLLKWTIRSFTKLKLQMNITQIPNHRFGKSLSQIHWQCTSLYWTQHNQFEFKCAHNASQRISWIHFRISLDHEFLYFNEWSLPCNYGDRPDVRNRRGHEGTKT